MFGSSAFGGRQPDNVQNIKQFHIASGYGIVAWIYKKILLGCTMTTTITTANANMPVVIQSDLIVYGNIVNEQLQAELLSLRKEIDDLKDSLKREK